MDQQEQEKLYVLSDVDCNTEVYKLFEEDINFFNLFLSFEKYSQILIDVENIPQLIDDPLFQELQQKFEIFVRNKEMNSFQCAFKLLAFLYYIRPKLLPIVILLTPIVFKIYSSHITEIKEFLLLDSYISYNIWNYYSFLLQNIFKENLDNELINEIDIKSVVSKFLQHPEYLTFSYNDPMFLKNQSEEETVKILFLDIVFKDDYEGLIEFLANHPNFKINEIMHPKLGKFFNIASRVCILPINLCCLFGSIRCFKYLYLNGCILKEPINEFSIAGGNYEIIQILNQNYISFDNCLGKSIEFHQYSLSNWLLTNYKIEKFVTVYNCIGCYNFKSLLFLHYNNFHRYDFSPSDYEIIQFIRLFCKIGYLPFLKYLAEAGFNFNSKDYMKFTPLHCACEYGFLPIVEYLITIGCDKEIKNKNGDTPLHFACEKGVLAVVVYLIKIGCNKELQNKKGETPLHIACKFGHLPIVQFLISKGCDKEVKDEYGKTPLNYAMESKNPNLINCFQSGI